MSQESEKKTLTIYTETQTDDCAKFETPFYFDKEERKKRKQ